MQFLLMPTFIFKNYMISSSLIPLHKEKQVSDVSELEDLRIIMYQSFIHSFIHSYNNKWCVFGPDEMGAFLASETFSIHGLRPSEWTLVLNDRVVLLICTTSEGHIVSQITQRSLF